jgi:hypothetical protein
VYRRAQYRAASLTELLKLRHHFTPMNNGTGDDMREPGHEKSIVKERRPGRAAAGIDVGQKCNLREGVEGYPDRQGNLRFRNMPSQRKIHICYDEFRIFEIGKGKKIKGNAAGQNRSSAVHTLCGG